MEQKYLCFQVFRCLLCDGCLRGAGYGCRDHVKDEMVKLRNLDCSTLPQRKMLPINIEISLLVDDTLGCRDGCPAAADQLPIPILTLFILSGLYNFEPEKPRRT